MLKTFAKVGGGALLFLIGLLVSLYWWWPSLVSHGLVRQLTALGFDHVVLEVGRPGWTSLEIPLLTFQKIVVGERFTVTIEHAHFGYTPSELGAGRIDRLEIPHASVQISPLVGKSESHDDPAATSTPVFPLERVSQPLPVLPVREVVLGAIAVRREGVAGTSHEGTFGGTVRLERARVRASLELQEAGGRAYRMEVDAAHLGDIAVSLESLATNPRPVLAVRSRMQPTESTMQIMGTLQADLHEMAPLLALFVPLSGNLEQVAGRLWLEWSGTASRAVPVEVLWDDDGTRLSGSFHLELRLPDWNGEWAALEVKADGMMAGNGRRAEWTLTPGMHLQLSVSPTVLGLPGWLFPGNKEDRPPLLVQVAAPVKGEADFGASPMWVTMKGPISVRYGNASFPLQVDLTTSDLSWGGGLQISANGAMRLRGRASEAAKTLLHAQDGTWDLDAFIAVENGCVHLTLDRKSRMTIVGLAYDTVDAPTVGIGVRDPVQVTADLGQGAWAMGPGVVTFRIPALTVAGLEIGSDEGLLTLKKLAPSGSWWKGTGSLQLTGLHPTRLPWTVSKSDWRVHAEAEPSLLTIQIEAATQDGLITVRGTAAQQVGAGLGQGRFEIGPVRLDATARKLSTLVRPWPSPLDATGGTLGAVGEATWGPREGRTTDSALIRSGSLAVELDGLTGQIKGYPFTGLSATGTVHLTGPDRLSMPEPVRISLAALHTGVVLTDLSARAQLGWTTRLTPEWVELRDLSTSVFGGRATSEVVRYAWTEPSHIFSVMLHRLKMQEILNLEQQKGLEGTGELDGVLPIVVTEDGATIEGGVIEARPPGGLIRYRPSSDSARSLASADSTMNLILQPLSNFHYNVLNAKVHYRTDGTLKLETRLEGKNPDWQKGRPVNFNLNVQENIPALIQSLGSVRGIEDSIEQRVDPRNPD